MSPPFVSHKQPMRSFHGVVGPQKAAQSFEQHGFAIRTSAIEDWQNLLCYFSDKRSTQQTLHVLDKLLVAGKDSVDKRQKQFGRTRRIGRVFNRTELC